MSLRRLVAIASAELSFQEATASSGGALTTPSGIEDGDFLIAVGIRRSESASAGLIPSGFTWDYHNVSSSTTGYVISFGIGHRTALSEGDHWSASAALALCVYWYKDGNAIENNSGSKVYSEGIVTNLPLDSVAASNPGDTLIASYAQGTSSPPGIDAKPGFSGVASFNDTANDVKFAFFRKPYGGGATGEATLIAASATRLAGIQFTVY